MPIKPLAKTREAKTLTADQTEDKPTRATRSKTSKATVLAAKKSAPAPTKAAATSNRKHETEEADTTFEQQRTPQALTTSLINMKEVFYVTRETLLKDMDGTARRFYIQAHRPQFNAPWKDLIEDEAVHVIRDSLLQNRKTLGYTIKMCQSKSLILNKC